MKKYLFSSIIIGVILTLSGCNNISDNNVSNTDMSATANADISTRAKEDINANVNEGMNASANEDASTSEKYDSYIEVINEYMNNFKNLYIDVITMEENISLISGEMDVVSTEGNTATKYIDFKENVIRYNLVIYGETGKIIKDYYVLDDNKLYVVELHETYSSPMLGIGSFDILSYDMKKYIVDGNDVYCLDDVAKKIIITNQKEANVYMTLDELNTSFTETDK